MPSFRKKAAGLAACARSSVLEYLHQFIDLFLHLDKHLNELIQTYGAWTYGILFTIIFLETGIVFTPFLPGDSLLFAAGALADGGGLNVLLLFVLLCTAAILGDTANYAIGKYFGAFLLRRHSRWFKPQHLERTHAFFERYGGKTIIIARFVPIVRTFAPFIAGMGAMTYARFFAYNVVGGVLWVAICLAAGYLFGQIPVVKQNFTLVIFAIIGLSLLPIVFEFLRHRWGRQPAGPAASQSDSGAAAVAASPPARPQP